MQLIVKVWSWGERIVALLGGRTITMLFIALITAVGTVIFTDNWIVTFSRQVEVLRILRDNVVVLHELKIDLLQAESAQRGYLLTTRIEYLAPFNLAIKQARSHLKNSEALLNESEITENKSSNLDLLKAISASVEAKSTEMMLVVNLIKQNKIEEAHQIVNLDMGRLEMQKFIATTDQYIEALSNDVNVRLVERRNSVNLARASSISGAIVLILLVIMVIQQLLKELATKSHLQQQALKENADYEVKLKQQTKLLRSMALDYQADVERERQKLSRELHDELGSIFTATKMDLAWCIKKLADSAPDVAQKLAKTTSYVDQGIQYQRHIVQELHPSMISTFGFWPALTALIKDAAERNKWRLSLNLPDETTPLNETISLVTYRIVQESLNNANKYARATAINVDVMLDAHHIKLEISDNGIGVDMQSLDGLTHGLSGMRHRVQAIGGHFEMLSNPSQGVLIRALIPLDVAPNNAVEVENQQHLLAQSKSHTINS